MEVTMKYLHALALISIGLSMAYDSIYTFFIREPFGPPSGKYTLFSVTFLASCYVVAYAVRWAVWNKDPLE